jgi:DNA-binding NarL/FixJ family response regulator
MEILRVLVADDHRLMLAAVKRVFENADGFAVVGEVTRGSQVLPAIESLQPDAVTLDIRMPDLNGLQCIERIRARGLRIPIVVLSSYADEAHVEAARAAGASAYAVKTVDPSELPLLVRDAVGGADFRAMVPRDPDFSSDGNDELSDRERAVMRALAQGLTNREIATELWVSEQTVKFHLRNTYRKLGVGTRGEATRWAHRNGLVGSPPATVAC